MALSDKTKEFLGEAASDLRIALYWASKNERPTTIRAIAELLDACDKIAVTDDVLDSLDNMKDKWARKHNLDDIDFD